MAQVDTDATPDSPLEFKKRARRRLVGAAAFALLAAIVLPMVMDREPRPLVQDVQIRIPSQDGDSLISKLSPNKATPTPLPPSPPDSDDEVDAAPGKASGAVATETKPVAEKKPEKPAPASDKPAETLPSPAAKTPEKPKAVEKPADKPVEKPVEKPAEKPVKPAEKATDKPADKPVAKPAADKAEEAKARAALSGQEAETPWLVLIGAYKDEANVKQLTGKMKQSGVPVMTEPFSSPQGPRTRVRAGPFKNQEAAERALAKLKKIGIDGVVKQTAK